MHFFDNDCETASDCFNGFAQPFRYTTKFSGEEHGVVYDIIAKSIKRMEMLRFDSVHDSLSVVSLFFFCCISEPGDCLLNKIKRSSNRLHNLIIFKNSNLLLSLCFLLKSKILISYSKIPSQ